MATIRFDGLDEYISQLQKVESGVGRVIGRAVFDGAKVVADSINAEIASLPEGRDNWVGTPAAPARVTREQKQGLLDGLAISHIKNDGGFRNVKIGFGDYNNVRTRKYPKGQPNVMIARAVVSGTSFRQKNNFISRAVKKSKKAAENAMRQTVDQEIQKIIK